jgi:hypothetical protein
VAVPAALASQRATGDGVLELKAVSGTVQIGTPLKPARGALWGQMDSGTLKVLDPDASDRNIFVSGYDAKPVVTDTVNGRQTVYTGHDLHFRVTGGKYKLWFQGTSIDLTAVGIGVARLSGDPMALNAGKYTVDDGSWIAVPVYLLPGQWTPVSFGDQSAQTQTTTTP